MTLIHRFGSAANLNVHLHCLVLDGVYRSGADGVPEFIEAAAPTEEALHVLLQTVIARLTKRLTRRGVLLEDDGQSYRAAAGRDPGRDPVLGPDAGHGAQQPPRLRRLCASPWRAPRMARASQSAGR